MPAIRYDDHIRNLASFGTELTAGRLNRRSNGANVTFALDANVMWFYVNASQAEDITAAGYAAKFIGAEQVASLIRKAIDVCAISPNALHIAKSHKHEADMAYINDLSVDYEAMEEAVKKSFEQVRRKIRRTKDSGENSAKLVVETLREEFRESYDLLLDVIGKGPTKKINLEKHIRSIPSADEKNIPYSLNQTLRKIAFILREGEGRAGFSVSQDIRALRDIALHNAGRDNSQIVFITFDQKLANIIRLMQYFGEPWSRYLYVESGQTFWLWNLPNILGSNEKNNRILNDIFDDFLVKTNNILTPRLYQKREEFSFELYNLKMLKELSNKFKNNENNKECKIHKTEILSKIDNLIDGVNIYNSQNDEELGIISTAYKDFFKELSNLFPSLAISKFEDSRNESLMQMFAEYGWENDAILLALSDDIEEHAARSFTILGASSLLAPKTIRAINIFSNWTSGNTGSTKFVHRLPLPIQGENELLGEVVDLVSKKGSTLKNRYRQLLKMKKWYGATADLAVSYLYASCGFVVEAESICLQSIAHRRQYGEFNEDYYELCLLRAAVLRIHKTSSSRLLEAKSLLDEIKQMSGLSQPSDPNQLRAESEILAGEVNQLLLERFQPTNRPYPSSQEAEREPAELATKLLMHKETVQSDEKLSVVLSSKLCANVNVNIIVVQEFLVDDDSSGGVVDKGDYEMILGEVLDRTRSAKERISYFEEIITSFALIKNAMGDCMDDTQEIELVGSLHNRLGWVLQKRENLNEFEYSLCEFVHSELNQLGFR